MVRTAAMPKDPFDSTFGLMGTPAEPSSELGVTIGSSAGISSGGEEPLNLVGLFAPPTGPDEIGWLAHYRILRVLGRGGMGAVFESEDTHLQRIVALKIILPQYAANSVARDRFLREARACAALKNDHIITIYQVGQDRDIPFLAMEYLQGETLERRLDAGGALPISEVLRIGREVAHGLAAAHAQGLIHRDIKPANIWLESPNGRVKLLDFGLARPAGSSSGLTQTGNIVGTPEFMSPEQARGDELDARSDLFSLGAVLYSTCSGKNPFQGSSVMAVLTALAVDSPQPIRDLNPDVPEALANLIGRLLQKKPGDRPASAEEVQAAIDSIEPGGITVRPSGSHTRTQSNPRGPTIPIGRSLPSPEVTVAPSRLRMKIGAGIGAALIAGLAGWLYVHSRSGNPVTPTPTGPPIHIGVLHSRTGTMAMSEQPVIDATLLAVDELNAGGGVLGRPVEAVFEDGESDEEVFAQRAERLISEKKVRAIFGCWTSASRKAVVPVVEKHDHLLFYPVQFEGLEQSPNVVYLGLVPNQQVLPSLRWFVGFENKRRWFLVGSDYVYPVTANAVIRDEAKARGCEIVGEEYLLLGSTDVGPVIQKIAQAKPDLIVNTINGDTNVAFFRAMRRAGIKSKDVPTLSFSVYEGVLSSLSSREIAGDYVSANYFHSLESKENEGFVQRFGHHYGTERLVSSPAETAYAAVHLWAKAVEAAKADDPVTVKHAIKGMRYDAPQGPIQICPDTQYTVQFPRIGRIDEDGRIMEVYCPPKPVEPEPFPSTRSRADWSTLLASLQQRWGGRWSNPGP
jgi:urea transport system substrate-binding protein